MHCNLTDIVSVNQSLVLEIIDALTIASLFAFFTSSLFDSAAEVQRVKVYRHCHKQTLTILANTAQMSVPKIGTFFFFQELVY